jgi:hypothetical protein
MDILNLKEMPKTFQFAIFRGAETMAFFSKKIEVTSQEELDNAKNAFKLEYKWAFKNPKNWLQVKKLKQ